MRGELLWEQCVLDRWALARVADHSRVHRVVMKVSILEVSCRRVSVLSVVSGRLGSPVSLLNGGLLREWLVLSLLFSVLSAGVAYLGFSDFARVSIPSGGDDLNMYL